MRARALPRQTAGPPFAPTALTTPFILTLLAAVVAGISALLLRRGPAKRRHAMRELLDSADALEARLRAARAEIEAVALGDSEAVIHTANVNNKNISGNMKKGDAVPWIARSPGEYKVTCDYHPLMKATIVVTS